MIDVPFPKLDHSYDASMGAWLDQNVGRFGEEWGRTYNLNKGDPDYGCSWWFRDPAKATMTLLRWS